MANATQLIVALGRRLIHLRLLVPYTRSASLAALLLLTGRGPDAAAQSLQLITHPAGPVASATAAGDSFAPLLSPDGRFVLFSSTACNLLLASNGLPISARSPAPLNVYLRDRQAGTLTLVSVNLSGTNGGNADSVPIALSTNGQQVLFESRANDLVVNDTNGTSDIFLRDLGMGVTRLISVNTNGVAGNGASRSGALTPDGRFAAFVSAAADLVPGDTNRLADVFLRDLQAGVTFLVSTNAVPTNSIVPAGSSEAPKVSADGRYVAFFSTASNLVAGVPAGGDVYVRDLQAGVTTWVSSDARAALLAAQNDTNAVSCNFDLSADGQYLAYEVSSGTNTNTFKAGLLFRYSLSSGTADLLETNAAVGLGAADELQTLRMSPDGRFITYVANTNTGSGQATCIRLWDANSGLSQLVSGDLQGQVPAGSACDWPAIDSTGRFVAFLSTATGLTTNALRGDWHVYMRDLAATNAILIDADTNGVGARNGPLIVPALSQDGHWIAFESTDPGLVALDQNRSSDVFLRGTGQGSSLELVSARHAALPPTGANGFTHLFPGSVSQDARWVTFASDADNLTANDTNALRDVFVRDLITGTNLLISAAADGAAADGFSSEPVISSDGRFVAFSSVADNLVPNDGNNASDVFVKDLRTGLVQLVSVNSSGSGSGNSDSYAPSINNDGRYILFRSKASDLAGNIASPGTENLFLRDRQSGTTSALTTGGVSGSAMTPDGHFIAFTPYGYIGNASPIFLWDSIAGRIIATNLIPFGTSPRLIPSLLAINADATKVAFFITVNGIQVVVWDRTAGTTTGIFLGWKLGSPALLRFSGLGNLLAFTAPDPTQLTSLTNQIYVHDFQSGANILVSHRYSSSTATVNGPCDSPILSPDGRFVAYRSAASDLVANDTNGLPDIFLYDRQTGSNSLLNVNTPGGFTPSNRSRLPVLSGDARVLLFQSSASDLVPNDFGQGSDLFAYSFFYARVLPSSDPAQGPVISWPFTPLKHYSVQFKDDFPNAAWQPLNASITNNATRAWLQDGLNGTGRRFYRVLAN